MPYNIYQTNADLVRRLGFILSFFFCIKSVFLKFREKWTVLLEQTGLFMPWCAGVCDVNIHYLQQHQLNYMCWCVILLSQKKKPTKQNGFHVSCLCTMLIVWTLTYAIGIVKTRTYRLVPSVHWCKYSVLYVYIHILYLIFCVQSAFVAFTITK